jgi:hypothetical protein
VAGADFRLNPLAQRRITFAGSETFFAWLARNPLQSLESAKGIQENPRESKPDSLGFLGFSWSGSG